MPWVTATIQAIFNHQFAGVSLPAADTTLFLGLATNATIPTLAGLSFTEVTTAVLGSTYARQPVSFAAATGSARNIISNITCEFEDSATPSVSFTIRYGGVFPAVTGGTPIAIGRLATDLIVNTGALVSIPAGQLIITDDSTALT